MGERRRGDTRQRPLPLCRARPSTAATAALLQELAPSSHSPTRCQPDRQKDHAGNGASTSGRAHGSLSTWVP